MNANWRWKPWRRFSLRTLLILTAIIAVWLGFFVRRVTHMRSVVSLVADYGGDVFYDYQPAAAERARIEKENRRRAFQGQPALAMVSAPAVPAWARKFFGDDYFRRISEIQLSETRIRDTDLLRLKSSRKLKVLSLAQTAITDDGLAILPVMPELHTLRLQGTKVTDDGLLQLGRQPALKEVDLRGTVVTLKAAEEVEKRLGIKMLHSGR